MATTTNRSLRYPTQGQEPDAAGDIQRLAEDVDKDLDRLFDNLPGKMGFGTDSITIGSAVASVTKVINLPAGFTSPPVVKVQNTANVAGRASLLGLYVTAVTTTNFTVKMQTADNANTGTSYAISFGWIAAGS